MEKKIKLKVKKSVHHVYLWLDDEIVYSWDIEDFTEEKLNRIVQKLKRYFERVNEVVEMEKTNENNI